MSVIRAAPIEPLAGRALDNNSASYSENARRRSKSTCWFSCVPFATFRACARHFRLSFDSGHITALR